MIENSYATDMYIKRKTYEIARGVEDARLRSMVDVPPSPLRRAVASAIVRFGIFLNGSAYHCPDSGEHAMGAHTG